MASATYWTKSALISNVTLTNHLKRVLLVKTKSWSIRVWSWSPDYCDCAHHPFWLKSSSTQTLPSKLLHMRFWIWLGIRLRASSLCIRSQKRTTVRFRRRRGKSCRWCPYLALVTLLSHWVELSTRVKALKACKWQSESKSSSTERISKRESMSLTLRRIYRESSWASFLMKTTTRVCILSHKISLAKQATPTRFGEAIKTQSSQTSARYHLTANQWVA